VRLFLAINLADDVRRAAWDATAPLREAAPGVGWVAAARLHLTLKFLGELSEAQVVAVSASLDEIGGRHRAFTVQLGGVGAFPNFRRPRVVWMGVTPDPRLELLHHDVEVACERLGFALDGRAFRPHLTLARARDRARGDVMSGLARVGRHVVFEAETRVESVDVMKSVLGAEARYEQLFAARLHA
jgi:2'-5' RNA ligase